MAFFGDRSSSKYHASKYFDWYRGPEVRTPDTSIVFFTDSCLPLATNKCYDSLIKIAWLIEPRVIYPYSYEYVLDNWRCFNLVLSHDRSLQTQIPNCLFYENRMCWVESKDFNIYPKNKNISVVASNKNYTQGHKLRHKTILDFQQSIDIYGYGYGPYIEKKVDALRDYRFNLAIENCISDDYFTEKIIDCFVTGTVPIYYGTSYVLKKFNPKGIVFCTNESELNHSLNELTKNGEQFYQSKEVQEAIEENFEIGKKTLVAEDYIYGNILKLKELL
jgi:hypothetical protein